MMESEEVESITQGEIDRGLEEACRSFIGTPFHHQGRVPGVGLDCAGVVFCGLKAIGFPVRDVRGYARCPSASRLIKELDLQLEGFGEETFATVDDVPAGFIISFRMMKKPRHLAIRSSGGMIHVVRRDVVREQQITDFYSQLFFRAFRVPRSWQP